MRVYKRNIFKVQINALVIRIKFASARRWESVPKACISYIETTPVFHSLCECDLKNPSGKVRSQTFRILSAEVILRVVEILKTVCMGKQVLSACGPVAVLFFTVVVFFGSFYLLNLMLAVVALSYEEEAEITNEVNFPASISRLTFLQYFADYSRELNLFFFFLEKSYVTLSLVSDEKWEVYNIRLWCELLCVRVYLKLK